MFIYNEFDYYISLSVNDIVIYAAGTSHLTALIDDLKMAFESSDLEEASFLLHLHRTYTLVDIALTYELYISTILLQFGMENENMVSLLLLKSIIPTKGTTEQPKDQVTTY